LVQEAASTIPTGEETKQPAPYFAPEKKAAIVGMLKGDIAATAADEKQPISNLSTLMMRKGRIRSAFQF
jgi:hypothetical protein